MCYLGAHTVNNSPQLRRQVKQDLHSYTHTRHTRAHTHTHIIYTHNTTTTHSTQHTTHKHTTHKHTTHNRQHTAHNTQHTTRTTQHTMHNTQHTTHSTQHTTHNTQHTTHNTTHNTQHTTHNTQHTTHNTQHTTHNTTHNTQHITHNTQHTYTQHITPQPQAGGGAIGDVVGVAAVAHNIINNNRKFTNEDEDSPLPIVTIDPQQVQSVGVSDGLGAMPDSLFDAYNCTYSHTRLSLLPLSTLSIYLSLSLLSLCINYPCTLCRCDGDSDTEKRRPYYFIFTKAHARTHARTYTRIHTNILFLLHTITASTR